MKLMINKDVELKSSFEWIKNGFKIFREAPLQFITLALISALLGMLPLLGAFMAPVLTARFATLAAAVESHRLIKFSELFDDLFAHKTVRTLALINFWVSGGLLLLQYLLNKSGLGSDFATLKGQEIMLLLLVPALLMQMAIWLSPIICLYDNTITAWGAMKLSFMACSYNIVTLLLYSVLAVAFTLLSILPVGLGLLIWLPTVNISYYFIYKSVFIPAKSM